MTMGVFPRSSLWRTRAPTTLTVTVAFQVPVDDVHVATRTLHPGHSKPRLSASRAALAHVRGQVDPEREGPLAGEAHYGAPATTRTLLDAAAGGRLCGLHGQWQLPVLVVAAMCMDSLHLEKKQEHMQVLASPELAGHWRSALLYQSLILHDAGGEG